MRHPSTTLRIGGLITAAVLLAAGPAPALAQQPAAGPAAGDYEFASFFEQGEPEPVPAFARVRFVDGGIRVVRAADGVAEEVGFNAPVYTGDRIETGARQRAELQLPDGTLLRIDRLTGLQLASLADPSTGSSSITVIALERGSLQADVPRPRGGDAFRVDTPSASVYPLEPSAFRVDVGAHDVVKVSVEFGRVEVAGEGGSRIAYGGERLRVMRGRSPGRPYAYNALIRDRFDDWVRRRDDVYEMHATRGPEYDDLPEEVRPYYGELSSNGRWVYLDDLGWAWVPAVDDDDWAPYTHGYWDDGPYGPVWVSLESWGWPVYRYGRWHFSIGIGWTWIPGRVFAPAHVYWYYGPSWVGWVPIDVWGWPVYVGIGHTVVWHDPFFDPYPWVFVDYGHFYHHPVWVHRLPRERIIARDLRRGVITRRAVVPPAPARRVRGNARPIGVRELDGRAVYRRATELARTRPALARRAADLPRDIDPGELRRLRSARSVRGARAHAGRAARSSGVRGSAPAGREVRGTRSPRDARGSVERRTRGVREPAAGVRGKSPRTPERAAPRSRGTRPEAGDHGSGRSARRGSATGSRRPIIRYRRLDPDTGATREPGVRPERSAPRADTPPRTVPDRGATRARTFGRARPASGDGAGRSAADRAGSGRSTDENVRRFFGRVGESGSPAAGRVRGSSGRVGRPPEAPYPRTRGVGRAAPERGAARGETSRTRSAPRATPPSRTTPRRPPPERATPRRVAPRERGETSRTPRATPPAAPRRVEPSRSRGHAPRRAPRSTGPRERKSRAPEARRRAPAPRPSRPAVRPSGRRGSTHATRPSRGGSGGSGKSRGSRRRR